jgi:hypothetical protein
MVEAIFKFETFYFSYSYDITHTLQRLQNTSPDFSMTPLYERVCIATQFEVKIKF